MQRSLLIRADANAEIGAGHVMRCLALAAPWIAAGRQVTLASESIPDSWRQKVQLARVAFTSVPAIPGSEKDAAFLKELICKGSYTHCVVDGYAFTPDYVRLVRTPGRSILVCDDFGHMAEAGADFLLNPNMPGQNAKTQSHRTEMRRLLGPRFAALRPEFSEARKRRMKDENLRGSVRHLLLLAGGSDPHGLSEHCLAAIPQLQARPDRVTLVVGGANPRLPELQQKAAAAGVETRVDVADMAGLMEDADLAFSAGGSTIWELCCIGVPTIAVVTADNQLGVVQPLADRKAIHGLGKLSQLNLKALKDAIDLLMANPARRAALSSTAFGVTDGLGAERVFLALNADAVRLRPASETDSRMMFEWANDAATRTASFSSEAIPWPSHEKWFVARINNPTTRIWIAELDGTSVGIVRLEAEQDRAARISINLAPAERGRGLGGLVLWAACRRWFSEEPDRPIVAQIRPENTASIGVFLKVGFEFQGEETVNGQAARRYVLSADVFEA